MKNAAVIRIAIVGAGVTAVLASLSLGRGVAGPPGASSASAAPPTAQPSSAPATSASASLATKPLEEIVSLASLPIPTDVSKRPKADEWAQARPVTLARKSSATGSCSASFLREYLKVACPVALMGVRQFVGPIDDVELVVMPKDDIQNFWQAPLGGFVVVPLRKGKTYVFRFFGAESGYEGGAFPVNGPLLDVNWPESDAAPTVTLR